MVRISNTISSKMLLAFFYASMLGLITAFPIWLFDVPDPIGWLEFELSGTIKLQSQFLFYSILWCPVTLVNVLKTSPSRIIITDKGISAKFIRKTRTYGLDEIIDINILESNRANFLVIHTIHGKLKVEVDLGQIQKVNEYLPVFMNNKDAD